VKLSRAKIVLFPLMLLFATVSVFGHVTIWPKESATGVTEKYAMRVPNERATSTIRIELEIPANVTVNYFEAKAGWKFEPKKNAEGKIVGAVWSGGVIAPNEFMEFEFLGRNPAEETTVIWKAIQTYADGTKSEWVSLPGQEGSPASVTTIKKPK
jgi:uncharacterized protein YcnI